MMATTLEKQTRMDMEVARRRTAIDVSGARDLIHGAWRILILEVVLTVDTAGGRAAWEEHSRMVNILSQDSVFDPRPRSIS
jgi:hypothetical protein